MEGNCLMELLLWWRALWFVKSYTHRERHARELHFRDGRIYAMHRNGLWAIYGLDLMRCEANNFNRIFDSNANCWTKRNTRSPSHDRTILLNTAPNRPNEMEQENRRRRHCWLKSTKRCRNYPFLCSYILQLSIELFSWIIVRGNTF